MYCYSWLGVHQPLTPSTSLRKNFTISPKFLGTTCFCTNYVSNWPKLVPATICHILTTTSPLAKNLSLRPSTTIFLERTKGPLTMNWSRPMMDNGLWTIIWTRPVNTHERRIKTSTSSLVPAMASHHLS